MPFEPGLSGNPNGRPKAEKSFANMLRIAIKEAHDEGRDKLRAIADALVSKAVEGDVPAIKEIADRLDGKVPQAVVGDDEADPIRLVQRIERVIVDA
jgi:hypothetical protein